MDNAQHPGSPASDDVDWLGRIGIGTWTWDPAAGTVSWDNASHHIYGLTYGSFDGKFESFIAMVHPDDRDEVLRVISEVAATGGDYSVRHRIVTPSGEVRWIEGQGRISTENGVPQDGRGIVYLLSDRMVFDSERDELTAGQELARAETESTREQLRFLIDLTDAITGSLNTERVARHFVSFIADTLADSCIVDITVQEPFGNVMTCAGGRDIKPVVTVATPAVAPAAARRASISLDPARPVTPDVVEMDTPEQAAILRDGPTYAAVFPVTAHGSRIGTVTAIRFDRAWTRDARDLIRAATKRVAGAFDRAELHADRSKFVAMFQASATPRDLPDIPSVNLGVHYRPATELVRLGGDLYDVFQIGPDAWMVAVGDICGKGIVAAGHAELARTALRSAAFSTGDPVDSLNILNRTLLAESSRPMLTAVLARFDLKPEGIEVQLATAGHPPPIHVLGPDDWTEVDVGGTMLGATENAKFRGATVKLSPGQSLTMYTDGVTESRFGMSFFGVERLGKTLARAWPSSAEATVGDVASTLDTWAAGQPVDDVLLLVARAEG
ncbi:MAG: SpoIIE family protein phosphatase [Acidimicrobiia bacterium]|nr:SpoIIE family protein phosphatase [Acidimicrobiia bacterium]